MAQVVNTHEVDPRVGILNTLLTCPHREVTDLLDIHTLMVDEDPIFYAHLAVWAMENTPIRDHKEVFVARLFLSEYPEHRDAAYVLLQNFPPYQVNRIIDHIKGKTVITPNGKVYQKRFGKNLPRVFRSAVKHYLRIREADRDWFDTAAINDRQALKSLYARTRTAPGNDHVRAVLFEDGEPESDSLFSKFRLAAAETDPVRQAEMIVELNIPFTKALGMVKEITPTSLVALTANMSDRELLNNLKFLRDRGAFENPDVKNMIDQKLAKAQKSKNVDALKASQAAKKVDLDEDTQRSVKKVTDEQLKKVEIASPTALLVDKSSSMTEAIEAAKAIGAMISARCTSDFFCYAFDRAAFSIKCASGELSDWEIAMRGIKAQGGTAIGAPLQVMARKGQVVDQFVIISDFTEYNDPRFAPSYMEYCDATGTKPRLIMVKIEGRWGSKYREFLRTIEPLQVDYDMHEISAGSDYYALPTLLTYLTKPSKFELVQEILEIDLPSREDLKS